MQIALLIVAAGGLVLGQLASLAMRRALRDNVPYAVLLVACAGLLVFVHETNRQTSVLGFVGMGAALVLAILPALLESREQAALAVGKLLVAKRWQQAQELIVPGRAIARRRISLDNLIDFARHGLPVVEPRLRRQIAAETDVAKRAALAFDLAHFLLLAQRVDDALTIYNDAIPDSELSQRPAVAALLLRGLLERDRLPAAMKLLLLLEKSEDVGPPEAVFFVLQARLLFLAHVGHEDALRAILDGPVGPLLGPAVRASLLGHAVQQIAAGYTPTAEVQAFADALAARAQKPFGVGVVRTRPILTFALIALNLAIFVFVDRMLGDDALALARAGALYRPAVLDGEWWRLAAAPFLHAGWVHLGINLFGLWALGRIVESAIGRAPFLIVYLGSALIGTLTSTAINRGALSVGASGALFGLVGGLFVIVWRGTERFSAEQRRRLISGLLFLVALQVLIGWRVDFEDNAVHVGGLVGGALLALAFARPSGPPAPSRWAASIAALLCVFYIGGGIATALTSVDATLLKLPTREVKWHEFAVTVPAHFVIDEGGNALIDTYLGIAIAPTDHDGEILLDTPNAKEPRVHAFLLRTAGSIRRLAPTAAVPRAPATPSASPVAPAAPQ